MFFDESKDAWFPGLTRAYDNTTMP